jgi:hypothetical protein
MNPNPHSEIDAEKQHQCEPLLESDGICVDQCVLKIRRPAILEILLGHLILWIERLMKTLYMDGQALRLINLRL